MFLGFFWLPSLFFAKEKSWPDGSLAFFEELTSPLDDWAPNDFGSFPTEEEKALLKKFCPRIFIGPKSIPPIDFYTFYLPWTVLRNDKRSSIKKSPTREELKKKERSPGYFLDYKGKPAPCRGVSCKDYSAPLYGRVFYETLASHPENATSKKREVIILKYTPVFSMSGLPAKLKWWKFLGVSLLAFRLEDWHELDIHGAIHILLDARTKKPIVLLLAQHNHFQSMIVGKEAFLPDDDRFPICYSVRSNEPYLCSDTPKPDLHRAVGDPTQFRYVVLGTKEPLAGGRDVVFGPNAGAVELNVDLKFLSSLDPLYVSWIPLGDKRKILGLFNSFSRTGPPGINMNTWPVLKKYTDMAQFWYFEKGDEKAIQILESNFKEFFHLEAKPLLNYHSKRFWRNLEN